MGTITRGFANLITATGISGLSTDYVRLASGTASGSSTSISLDGYFTSAYDVYVFTAYDLYSSNTGGVYMQFRYRASNADLTSSLYNSASVGYRSYNGGEDTQDGGSYQGNVISPNSYLAPESTAGASVQLFQLIIFNPLSTTNYKYGFWQHQGHSAINNQCHFRTGNLFYKSTSAIGGLSIFFTAGNIYGKYQLYGIKNS